MNYCEDYYKILQVHYMAEPEVIDGAYRRLAKKYHPDRCMDKGSEAMMKKINEAYEVLKDSAGRRKYHREWVRRYNSPPRAYTTPKETKEHEGRSIPARTALEEYFDHLLNRDYENAFAKITDSDKRRISKGDFIRWQDTVNKVFQLRKFQCIVKDTHPNMVHNGVVYRQSVDIYIVVEEYNAVMDRIERDYLIKTVVQEGAMWKVLLGYEGLIPLIERFEGLAAIITAKSIIDELVETHSKVDTATGFLNKRGFMEMAEREHYRFCRYGNPYSLAVCEIGEFCDDEMLKDVGKTLESCLRKLDIIGRWWDSVFVILLPETDAASGVSAAKKILKFMKEGKFAKYTAEHNIKLTFGISGCGLKTLEETIYRAQSYANIGKRLGGNTIVSQEGIIEGV